MTRTFLATAAVLLVAIFGAVSLAKASDTDPGGGGAYPYWTGSCTLNNQGAMATFGYRRLWCHNGFWVDLSNDGFYID